MTFLAGSLNLKRYFIEDISIFKKEKEKVLSKLQGFGFVPIEERAVEEQVGWVSPFKTTEINHVDVFFDSYIYLAMRVDRKKINQEYLTLKFLDKIQKENLSIKSTKHASNLKEELREKLIKTAVPETIIIDAIIDVNSSTLFVNSGSQKYNNYFLTLFGKTFDIKPKHIDSTMFALMATKSIDTVASLGTIQEVYRYEN